MNDKLKKIRSSVCLLIGLLVTTQGVASPQTIPPANVMIFISFSMPVESIKEWLQQAQKIGAPVIIRGLVNNSFKETISVMNQFSDIGSGVQVDPQKFELYHIQQVPAVVISDPTPLEQEKYSDTQFDVIYGDVSLDYALAQLSKVSTSRAIAASNWVKQLQGKDA